MPSSKYLRIIEQCRSRGRPYKDPDFPANYVSLVGEDGRNESSIEWRRPFEISKHAQFIVRGADYDDITQGNLGDCWFISAISILATNETLFERVVPHDQVIDETLGVFVFNFWINGDWQEVIIDDRLPTYVNGHLVYSKNLKETNEFWCPLMEKAYAKLYGSYLALNGGLSVNALVDMTGGISERFVLRPKDYSRRYKPEFLADVLLQCNTMNTLMGAGITAKSDWGRSVNYLRGDLLDQHAYSIIKVETIQYGHQNKTVTLVLIRDPNANKRSISEWKGPWSDNSPEWSAVSTEVKDRIGYDPERYDGEFWMNMEDLMVQFDDLDLLHLTPNAYTSEVADNMGKKEWKVQEAEGSWKKDITAGGQKWLFMNPQFRLDIEENERNETTVIISLLRYSSGKNIFDDDVFFGLAVYKLNPGVNVRKLDERSSAKRVFHSGVYRNGTREQTERLELDAGTYFIIPSTYKEGEEADFLLRVFSEKAVESRPIDDTTEFVEKPQDPKNYLIAKLFQKYSKDNKNVNSFQLQKILNDVEFKEFNNSDGVTLETTRSLLHRENPNGSGVLDLNQVKNVWEFVEQCKFSFVALDMDKSRAVEVYELRSLYNSLGFNVSYKVVAVIAKRYGNRHGKINIEDFIQSTAKVMSLYTKFREMLEKGIVQGNIEQLIMAAINS
ncbi:hypothetical protein SNE40_019169 [Patella caerulea]|uniref:Uncharacterized protein n=1 Tax=Patella caerulea TaxID=87958 RepID=A0AAN8P963_PATCE